MKYLGGKFRIARELSKVILATTPERSLYWEPFIGGGNVFEHVAPHFRKITGSDAHHDLMLMWQALRDGWVPPDSINEQEYMELKHSEPSARRAFAGFGCSFGGKWFAGYARGNSRDYAGESKRALVRQNAAWSSSDIDFRCMSYTEFDPAPGTVIYCDPPYANTTGYKATGAFDQEKFWETAQRWADSGCQVFIIEYHEPYDPIWTKCRDMPMHSSKPRVRTENLYYLNGGPDDNASI
jgi:DNA adenine methylase